jgi:cytochrome c oxidase subunit 3
MQAMGDVLPYRPPGARQESTAWLGMVIFLSSWAMMFAALFFAYGFVRTHSGGWPPADSPRLPVGWPFANTVLIGLSSLSLQAGVVEIRKGHARRMAWAVTAAGLLGAAFLVSQLGLWRFVHGMGLTPSTAGAYGSVFYGLTGFHGLHVLVGLVGLGTVAWRGFRGQFTAARFLPLRLWAMYWHFVGIIWGLLFVSVFAL